MKKWSMLALCGLMFSAAITGCGEDSEIGDILTDATVDSTDISAPTAVTLTVTSETTATITATVANATDDAEGYKLVNVDDSNRVVADTVLASFTGTVAFDVVVDKDVKQTWGVVSYEGSGVSKVVPVTFESRNMFGPYEITKISLAEAGEGLRVDDTVSVAPVAEGIKETDYADGGLATFYFENSKALGATITPINGAHVAIISKDVTPQQEEITEIAGLVGAYATTTAGTVVYSDGKSPRVDNAEDGDVVEMVEGTEILVVSKAGNVARVVVDGVSAEGVVSTTVYTPAKNDGVMLYKLD